MTKQLEETKDDQLEKALSEIDGTDSKDRQIFRIDSETFRFKDVEYKLIEDYKEAFDLEMMEERFSDLLLKYDYIVGDIAYEKLRLRGFYEDRRKGVPIDMKISNLEDYLVEYCNFGCQYFVFERVEKKKADPESYFKRNKKPAQNKNTKQRSRRNPSKNRNAKPNKQAKSNTPKNKNTRGSQKKKTQQNKSEPQKDFQVVKKQETKQKPAPQKQKSKPVKEKKETNNKSFEIRKKTDE